MRRLRSAPARWAVLGVAVLALLVVVLPSGKKAATRSRPRSRSAWTRAPELTGQAPDFKLTDQFGAPVSLSSFRGKVVILAFNDSQCTTVCPLTTTAMVGARRLLGAAGSKVQLLGIDANPTATSVKDVRAYSEVHGMTHDWHFLTGSRAQLKRVWKAYHIEVAIERGQIDHTPALFVINPAGGLAKLYLTQMSYSSVDSAGAAARPGGLEPAPGPSHRRAPRSPTSRSRRSPRPTRSRCRGPEVERSASGPERRGCCCSSPAGIAR